MSKIAEQLGIKGIRQVSESTTVVDSLTGSCRPATSLEMKMWD